MKRNVRNGLTAVGLYSLVVVVWILLSLASLAATVFVVVWVLRAMGVL